jgi:hypothetical protein
MSRKIVGAVKEYWWQPKKIGYGRGRAGPGVPHNEDIPPRDKKGPVFRFIFA